MTEERLWVAKDRLFGQAPHDRLPPAQLSWRRRRLMKATAAVSSTSTRCKPAEAVKGARRAPAVTMTRRAGVGLGVRRCSRRLAKPKNGRGAVQHARHHRRSPPPASLTWLTHWTAQT